MVRTGTVVAAALMVGCIDGENPSGNKDKGNSISTSQFTTTSTNQGIASVEVEVTNKVDVFSIYASSDKYISVESIIDPDGNTVLDWSDWDGAESLTGAIYLEGTDTILNWPVREEDGELTNGTWTVEIATINSNYYYTGNVDVDVTLQTRQEDNNFNSGKITAEVVYAGDVGDDADVVAATEAAVDRWKEIWADYDLTLKVSYRNASSMDPNLTDLSEGGSSVIETQSAKGTDSDVLVLIGEEIGSYRYVYGISGGIPGTPVESPRSAVVISWLANAGGDGSFSEDDIRLYGETLAHEVGHYTGLFHPVEDGWQYYDALSDTSDCTSMSRCESDLGDNLMFPYPVCTMTSCTPQDQLSGQQAGVMQRYIGTL